MKKRLLPLLALLCALFVLPCAAQAADGDWGSDYETNSAFYVRTVDDLFTFAGMVNEGYDFADKNVYLTSNIDLSGREWIPIGISRNAPFRGAFYGGDHIIQGLTYTGGNEPASGAYAVGLFGYVNGDGSVTSLNLSNVSIDVPSSAVNRKSITGVGCIIGTIDMYQSSGGFYVVSDCSVSGHVVVKGNAMTSVGGVVGQADGSSDQATIRDCRNRANVESPENSGAVGAGGILGGATMTVDVLNCTNSGNISGYNNIGGIIGIAFFDTAGEILNCQNTGSVTGSLITGGIIGWSTNAGVANCTNSATIRSNAAGNIGFGGIAGFFSIDGSDSQIYFLNCTNRGTVDAPDSMAVGGIVGSATGLSLQSCKNSGDVYGDTSVGGICGGIIPSDERYLLYLYHICQCENSGDIDGYGIVGGIVGNVSGVELRYADKAAITNNINRGYVRANGRVGGIIGMTDSDLYKVWPLIRDNKNLGGGNIGGAIIGYNSSDALTSISDDTYANQRIYHNYWTNANQLPLIGDGIENLRKRIWGNGAYNVATGLLDEPYTDPYGNRIISIDGQIAPPEEPEEPEQPQEPDQITIVFDAGGFAENPSDIITSPGASIFLPSLADTGDQRFLGWTVNGLDYQAGDTVAVYENMVFTARWEAIGEDPGADMVQEVWMTIGSSLFTADGEERSMDTAPFISNSRTYVPIRALAEAFGAQVEWDGIGRTVTIDLDGSTIVMYMGSVTYFVNGDVMEMDVEPVIVDSRTCVPVRFVTEAVGFRVTPHYSPFDHTTEAVQFNRY